MWLTSLLRSPKKEEQLVPDNTIGTELSETKNFQAVKETDNIIDEFNGILGFEDGDNFPDGNINNMYGQFHWNFMDMGDFSITTEEEEGEQKTDQNSSISFREETHGDIKIENHGFWDDDEKKMSLNLSLNYKEVLEAWSDRGSLWADGCSLSTTANHIYMGEVPVMEEEEEEERTRRREACVQRYKEKRQTRLFSKKIRYQVRKLNADKRPRLKGRFVKRIPDKIFK